MATKYQNLSKYDKDLMPKKELVEQKRFAIVVADWNSNVTFALLDGAFEALCENGAREEMVDVFHVPGTFELTYAAAKLQKQQIYDAIIVIGCVIQGDTPHFDYVCQGVTSGISLLNAEAISPVIFSVLTTNTMEQALERAGGSLGNKGVEGAVTAIKMIFNFADLEK
ncbi:MAG: 6,7-dimethyl-8-ribityllumazine synthase [Paludibacteraceae bacterium]|jgi:6,7-dimethyl-8-ribityllumazine synthase|nr:6,7-dimethyl-8-ribityllumazine synthase [Paludibacteraceae bacterium]